MAPTGSPRHLLTVWNPALTADPLDEHLGILLDWAKRRDRGEANDDDVYVWWGKVRSHNRSEELPHAREILALEAQIMAGTETHLYLTDYRSLYVGLLDEITADDVLREHPGEADHMPSYYQDHRCDFWFRLLDLRRLVTDDTLGVIEELRKLSNERYHGRPVSLYGGMVELPLIVSRAEEVGWFRDAAVLTGGQLWAQRDADLRGETERMERELRDNLIGRTIWEVFDPATRTFLAAAEATFRARRDDPHFDFSGPALGYAKAVETELNALIFPATRKVLAGRPPAEREINLDGRIVDLGRVVPHQTLGAIRNLLQHNDVVRKALRTALNTDANWLIGQVAPQLEGLRRLRNPAAHSETTGRVLVSEWRERVLGIGQEGLIVQLGRVRLRGR